MERYAQPNLSSLLIQKAEKLLKLSAANVKIASKRMDQWISRFYVGPDPEIFADLVVIGSNKLLHFGVDFAKWTVEMVDFFKERGAPAKFLEEFEENLHEIYNSSLKHVDRMDENAEVKPAEAPKTSWPPRA